MFLRCFVRVQFLVSLRWAMACLAASLGAGCASVSPEIGDMTRAYSDAIERHEMNQILRNLLRAADGLPMRFQAVPTVVGTGLLESNAGLSGKLMGGFLDNASASPSLKSSRGFNFNLASLDNERFTSAFVGDLSLETINVFSSGNVDRQTLFTLVLQSIGLKGAGETEHHIENDASSREDHRRFQSMLADLVAAGLRTETFFRLTPLGADLSRDEWLNRYLNSRLATDSAVRSVEVDTPSGPAYRLVRRERALRFCLSPQDYLKLSGVRVNRWLECRPPDMSARAEVQRPSHDHEAHSSLHFNIRSTRDVYRFVGQMIKAQMGSDPWTPMIRVLGQRAGVTAGMHPLIVVRKGEPKPGERAIAITEYHGSTYYVPLEDSGLSAQTFEALSLLLSASMVKDAIPASPGILVR